MRKNLLLATFLILVIAIGASYISTLDYSNQGSIKVGIAITKNYGKELIQQDTITVPSGTSVLEASKIVANMETSYGGGFVSSINGIKSAYPEERYDWFFYVNGFLAKEGAASYIVFDGDSIQWDYHNWESQHPQSAILGDYPKHLVNGYAGRISPTIIAYEIDFLDGAARLKIQLYEEFGIDATVLSIETMPEDKKTKSNIIILAKSNNKMVSEINEIHKRIGFYAFFDENTLIELDYKGKPYREYDNAGVIQVTQNIWNPNGNMACENVILLISGTDAKLVEKSADILIHDPSIIRYSFGLIVTEQENFKIPSHYEN